MHWTRRVGLLCLGLVSLGLARVSTGQDGIAVNDGGVVYLDDFSGSVFLSNDGGNYLLFHKVVGQGVGHEDGYSRLGVRTRVWEEFNQHFFGEVHALITDDARVGYNIGGGYRRQAGAGLLGLHAWYDDYESGQDYRYRQITGGFEYLHPNFDVRSNAYIPIDERENFINVIDQGNTLSFLGNNLVSNGTVALERAYYGWDLEGGGPVPLAENWLRAYAGVYQMIFDGDNTTGFRARAEARFMQGVNLNLIFSEDDKYGTNVNLGVEVRFRGTMPTRFEAGLLADRRYDQVRRVWPVQTNVDIVQQPLVVNNPGTDDPIQLVFIDNTNSGGTGTFDDPLEMLPSSDPDADLFLVNTGSGSTFGNITLADGQQILGAGKPHFVDTEEFGVIQLPAEFNQVSGNFPILESMTSTPIVTLANDNIVSGFNLIAENAIFGDEVNNFLIECLHSDVIENGVIINNATGTGVVRDVDFDVAAGGIGVGIINSTPGSTLNLAASEIMVDGGDIGVAVIADEGDVTYDIDNLDIENTETAGLALVGTSADLTGTVDGTVLDENSGHGLVIDLFETTGTSTITGLVATDNGTMGMELDGVRIVASDATDYTVNIFDSTIDGNMDDGIDADVDVGSTLTLNVDPTTVLNNGDNAFEFEVAAGSTLNANFDEVDMSGALNDAINGLVTSTSTANLNFTRFDASGATNDGLNVIVENGSTLTGNFDNTNLLTSNSFSNSGSSAINVDVSDDSDADLTFTNITADNLSTDGNVNLIASGNSQITSAWTAGSITNGTATGVTLDADGDGSSIDATFNDVAITGHGGDGINASLAGGDANSLLNVALNNVTLTGNSGDGLDYALDGFGSTGNIQFNNADLSGNTEDGFQFDVTGGADLTASTTSSVNPLNIVNDFSGNGSNAFQGTVAGNGSSATVTILDAAADSSGAEGALFNSSDNGTLTFNYAETVLANAIGLSNSGEDGIRSTTTTGATTNINLSGITLNDNGQTAMTSGDGFTGIVDDNATLNVTLDFIPVNNNAEKGFNFVATNDSIINVSPMGGFIQAMGNQEEGLFFDVSSGSMFAFNALDGSFSNNGAAGTFSGVRGIVDGTNSAATVSFDASIIDMNTGDGVEIDVTNGGMFIGELMTSGNIFGSFSAANNMGAGVSITADGAGTVAALIMDGDANISDNMEDGLIVTATNIEQLAIRGAGTFNNNMGDGINITGNGINAAAIDLQGGNTTTVDGNGGDGIEIVLNDSTTMDIDVTTLTQTVTVESFAVEDMTIDMNGGNSFTFTADNTTLADGSTISGLEIMNSNADGILVDLTDVTANNFNITNNMTDMNEGNGINLDLVRTTIDGLNIGSNTVGVMPGAGLSFLIDGNTFVDNPYFLQNTSDPGITLTDFSLDIGPSNSFFNTIQGASTPFQPIASSDVTVGLVSVNGNLVTPGTNPLQNDMGQVLPGGGVLDNETLLDLTFNDFDEAESMVWALDTDGFGADGAGLAGSTVNATFSDGTQLQGTMMLVPGNFDASIFMAGNMTTTGGTSSSMNMLNGILITADDSTLTNVDISDNRVEENGQAGIAVVATNGSTFSGRIALNDVNGNLGEGIRLDFDNSSLEDTTVEMNSIMNNSSDGILVDFDNNSSIANLTIQDNPDIMMNGGNGINLDMNDSNINGLLIDNNSMGTMTGGPTGDFDIEINLLGGLTPSQQLVFQTAEQRWEEIITGDVADFLGIDDLIIDAQGVPIDGPGGILGQAGPTLLRPISFLPAAGIMQFDTADLAALENSGQLNDVILHEMGHVLGIGTIWDDLGFLLNAGTNDPRFTGPQATAEYNLLFGGNTDPDIPVANTGGAGTRDSHWREATFDNELMTGFLNAGVVNPISRMTIASMADLGYVVDLSVADPYITAPNPNANLVSGPGLNLDEMIMRPDSEVVEMENVEMLVASNPALALGGEGVQALAALRMNGEHGINISLNNSNLQGGVISNNILSQHANGDGIRMLNPTTNGNTPIELDLIGNMIDGNGQLGVNIDLNGSESLVSNITDNQLQNNTNEAIRIDLVDNATLTVSDFSRNFVDGNGAAGVRIAAEGTSTVNFDAGAGSGDADLNVISGNSGVGLGFHLIENTTGNIRVKNTNISGTNVGSDPTFAGEGLAVVMTDMASLPDFEVGDAMAINTSFNGNARHGLLIDARLDSSVTNPVLQNFESNLNQVDGVNIFREGTATVDNVLIDQAVITDNLGDGIDIVASLADTTDEYTIQNSRIGDNAGHGVSLEARFDGDIQATFDNNQIGTNGMDGVSLTQFTNNPMSDSPTIAADFTDNIITFNQGWGVDVQATHTLSFDRNTIDNNVGGGLRFGVAALDPLAVIDITNGSVSNNGTAGFGTSGILIEDAGNAFNITGNTISGNGDAFFSQGDGITNLVGADSTISNNVISGNADNGIAIVNGTHTINNNMVEMNGDMVSAGNDDGDGIELISREGGNLTVSATGNTFRTNRGRGINLLVQGDTTADVTFNQTRVEGNMEEGVYIVNTAALSQSVDTPATSNLDTAGDRFVNPILRLNFDDNQVLSNGIDSAFEGTGFVLRVGTSGASTAANAHEDDGGFVSDGAGNLTGRGGVLASITNSLFEANPGSDVLIESFDSTNNSAPSIGTWDAATYDINRFEQDPLARLDLTFTGNTGDDTDVVRMGASYSNLETVFKSRTAGQTPAGPFNAGDRARNAQRLAFRGMNSFGDFSEPGMNTAGTAGNSTDFLYSGVGGSTFRITAGSDTSGFMTGDDFIDMLQLGADVGELPFTYDLIP